MLLSRKRRQREKCEPGARRRRANAALCLTLRSSQWSTESCGFSSMRLGGLTASERALRSTRTLRIPLLPLNFRLSATRRHRLSHGDLPNLTRRPCPSIRCCHLTATFRPSLRSICSSQPALASQIVEQRSPWTSMHPCTAHRSARCGPGSACRTDAGPAITAVARLWHPCRHS
jgi:hypothetical protein